VSIRAHRRDDPRVRRIAVYAHRGGDRFRLDDPGVQLVCRPISGRCRDRLRGGVVRYAAVAIDRWGESVPWYSAAVRALPMTTVRPPHSSHRRVVPISPM
jgi:hypothetical protein